MADVVDFDDKKGSRWKGVLQRLPDFQLTPEHTALVIVDMQYLDAHRDYGMGAIAQELGVQGAYEYFFTRVENIVIPNVQRLQRACRRHGVEVMHLRIASLVEDCREVSRLHRSVGLLAPAGSKEAQILKEVGPLEDELVITKGCSGAFNCTAFDRILLNMGIQNLIFSGVGLNGCVETSVRDAGDRNYNVVLVSDACAGYAAEHEKLACEILDEQYCKVRTTQQAVSMIERCAGESEQASRVS
jgi:nicotinamidase-related amidase